MLETIFDSTGFSLCYPSIPRVSGSGPLSRFEWCRPLILSFRPLDHGQMARFGFLEYAESSEQRHFKNHERRLKKEV